MKGVDLTTAVEPGPDSRPVVLTVDDDPIILTAVIAALKDEYTVRPFPSGEAALKFLESNHVDIILLDHNMPEMTGIDVLRRLQSDPEHKEIPVIFLTGSENSEDEVTALKSGAADYLLKPFRQHALLTRMRLQLELYRHRHQLEEMVQEQTVELRRVNKKLEQRDRITLDLLAQASDLRDHDTGAHIDRTTAYTRVLVMDLVENPKKGYDITLEHGQDIIDAVKLHDLGKLAMPDSVLLKKGRLSPEEFKIIKEHPIYGSEMIRRAIEKMEEDSLLSTALDITFGHHEKWDGTGYPGGLSGEDIPLSARISAIADVFDALTSDRPYKRAFTAEESLAIIYQDSGSHFDPYLVEVLRRHEKDFKAISLSTQDTIREYM
ncbi:MAG: response regulator [Coriobacteriia bacterium]|nr:response regulator [Coriobacteriia bacterium]